MDRGEDRGWRERGGRDRERKEWRFVDGAGSGRRSNSFGSRRRRLGAMTEEVRALTEVWTATQEVRALTEKVRGGAATEEVRTLKGEVRDGDGGDLGRREGGQGR